MKQELAELSAAKESKVKRATKPYVKGTFYNHDFPGRVFEFWFNNTWVSIEPETETEIPLEIYNHIKECAEVPLRKFVRERPDDSEGISGQLKIANKRKSYEFVRYSSFDKEV